MFSCFFPSQVEAVCRLPPDQSENGAAQRAFSAEGPRFPSWLLLGGWPLPSDSTSKPLTPKKSVWLLVATRMSGEQFLLDFVALLNVTKEKSGPNLATRLREPLTRLYNLS